jgi:NADH:ubiquinone oxidoreductase subunit 5 (subunit L)/multisubunit Na+/H+ antiporter MnhA subunit
MRPGGSRLALPIPEWRTHRFITLINKRYQSKQHYNTDLFQINQRNVRTSVSELALNRVLLFILSSYALRYCLYRTIFSVPHTIHKHLKKKTSEANNIETMKTLRLALLAYLFGSATASPFNLRANSRNHEQVRLYSSFLSLCTSTRFTHASAMLLKHHTFI